MSDSEYFATFFLCLQPIYPPNLPMGFQKYFDQTNSESNDSVEDETAGMAASALADEPSAAFLVLLSEASLAIAADTLGRMVAPHCPCTPSWSTGYAALPCHELQRATGT